MFDRPTHDAAQCSKLNLWSSLKKKFNQNSIAAYFEFVLTMLLKCSIQIYFQLATSLQIKLLHDKPYINFGFVPCLAVGFMGSKEPLTLSSGNTLIR